MKISVKIFLTSLMIVTLLGCAVVTPKIEKKYDELSKRTICRLENYPLKNFWGGGSACLNLEKDSNNIKTILRVIRVNHQYDFRNNPSMTFEVYHAKQLTDQIKINAKTVDAKDWQVAGSYDGIAVPVTTYLSLASSLMFITKDDFKKIANADEVKFLLSEHGHKDSIQGKLNKTSLSLLKQFEQECVAPN